MTTPINKLEPAFPRDHRHDGHNGMTIRDYFAAKALQGMLTAYPCAALGVDMDFDALAGDSYTAADAMLKARQS